MAQVKMICPFSHKVCTECAYYRGRHYYMCFCKEYRGYLGENQTPGNKGFARWQPPFAHSKLPQFEELEKVAKVVAEENRWEGLIAGE